MSNPLLHLSAMRERNSMRSCGKVPTVFSSREAIPRSGLIFFAIAGFAPSMLVVFAVVGNRPAIGFSLDVNVGRRPPGFHVDYCAVCFHGGRPWIMDGCVRGG